MIEQLSPNPAVRLTTGFADAFVVPQPSRFNRLSGFGQLAAEPVARVLPGLDSPLGHAFEYWRQTLPSLLGGHRLRHEPAPVRHKAAVHIDEVLRCRWHRLFEVAASSADTLPFLYSQSVGTLLYARIFKDLGINLRHLLHLRHRVRHPVGAAALAAAQEQFVVCGARSVLRLGADQVLVEIEAEVQSADGTVLALIEDGFVVRKLPHGCLDGLPSDRQTLRELIGLRRRPAQLCVADAGTCARWLPIGKNMGVAYREVSGDLNPVHTGGWAARLFGVRRPFLQGLALRSLVVRHLAEMGLPLDRLAITFAAPAYLGQTLCLLVAGGRFEVQDGHGHVIAFGDAE